jgi:hypothetical protein
MVLHLFSRGVALMRVKKISSKVLCVPFLDGVALILTREVIMDPPQRKDLPPLQNHRVPELGICSTRQSAVKDRYRFASIPS